MAEMRRRNNGELPILAALVALFFCRALLASVIVPPWQGPDEPTHFALTQSLALPAEKMAPLVMLVDGDFMTPSGRQRQEAIVRSMARHRWWEPYGGRAPDPLPPTLRDIRRLGPGTYWQPLYYGVGAAVLRAAAPSSVDVTYAWLRGLSIGLSLTTVVLAWAGTRLLFGPVVAAGATAIVVLNPQFLLTAISVNPDALLNVFGAAIWWQAARFFTGCRRDLSLGLVIVGAAAALFTKRSAMPLVIVAGGMAVTVLLGGSYRRTIRKVVFAGVVGALVAFLVSALIFDGPVSQLTTYWRDAFYVRRPLDTAILRAAIEYARLSVDYVWLIGGWLRFPAPEPWLWVVRSLTVAAFAGAALVTFRSPVLRRPLSIAWMFVIVQVGIIIGLSFWTLASPQGRYLFPVIAPATALLWLGLTQGVPLSLRPFAGPALILILALIDATAFTMVLVPAYLPWG